MDKTTHTHSTIGLIVATVLWCAALPAANRLQICTSNCKGPLCKRVAEDVEFELELSENIFLPPCKKGALPKHEFRLKFSQEAKQITLELQCHSTKTCMRTSYATDIRQAALTTMIVSDVKTAIKHNKPFEPEPKAEVHPPAPTPVPQEISAKEDEWDHVVVSVPKERPRVVEEPKPQEVPQTILTTNIARNKSVTVSFGAENWNYAFDSDAISEQKGLVRSRVYPGLAVAADYRPWDFVLVSFNGGVSMASLRVKANQPVDGDGQVVLSHMFYGSLSAGLFQEFLEFIDIGIEAGYDFQGALVEEQRILDKPVTVIPGFQSHALSVGPRLVVGRQNGGAMLDIRVGLNPYTYYFETPDEPTDSKNVFRWSARAVGRFMLGEDMYVDAIASAHVFHVHYVNDAIRENANGEKWGEGRVLNASSSFMVGLGWVF